MKLTLTLDEARELAGAVSGPLREKLLEAIVSNTETYHEGLCIWCHRTVSEYQGRWYNFYGRDVCKSRELGEDGEYQAHEVPEYEILTREKSPGPGAVVLTMAGPPAKGSREPRRWAQHIPLTRGSTWSEWFTAGHEMVVSEIQVTVTREP